VKEEKKREKNYKEKKVKGLGTVKMNGKEGGKLP